MDNTNKLSEEAERARFEAALRKRGYHYFAGVPRGPMNDAPRVWEYSSAGTEHAWQGWLAAKLDTPAAQPAVVDAEAQSQLLKAAYNAVRHFAEFSESPAVLAASDFGSAMDWLGIAVDKIRDSALQAMADDAQALGLYDSPAPASAREPACDPTQTECQRCRNVIANCDGVFAGVAGASEELPPLPGWVIDADAQIGKAMQDYARAAMAPLERALEVARGVHANLQASANELAEQAAALSKPAAKRTLAGKLPAHVYPDDFGVPSEFTKQAENYAKFCVHEALSKPAGEAAGAPDKHWQHFNDMNATIMRQRRQLRDMQRRLDAARHPVAVERQYPLPDNLYPGSKDWLAGDYASRVEWLHAMYEARKADVERMEAVPVAVDADVERDAARYRLLRANHWSDGDETLVVVRAKSLRINVQTFSGHMLDEAIDNARQAGPSEGTGA